VNILLVTETLHTGGAETFVVRLANALHHRGHQVFLFVVHPRLSKGEILDSIHPGITVILFQQAGRKLKQKADSLFYRLGIDFSFLQREVSESLQQLIRERQIAVVHSHLFPADYYVACLNKAKLPPFRHVSTHHGDYLLFQNQRPYGILHYLRKLQKTVQSLSAMAVISEEQRAQFNIFRQRWRPQLMVAKILNGYEATEGEKLSRANLGIGEDDFVFGMVARGIPEKGWELLIDAFLEIDLPQSRLLLVGEGPEIQRLLQKHSASAAIHFAGYSANTIGYIRLFDVGVLPSYYKAESLPTVVIEYLYCNKPVIATAAGEIEQMVRDDFGNSAGILVPLKNGTPDVLQLAEAMRYMAAQKPAFQAYATGAFEKFDMATCVAAYLTLYKQKPD